MKIILVVISLAHISFSISDQIIIRKEKLQPLMRTTPARNNVTSCFGPYIEPGECKNIRECQPLLSELRRIPNNENFRSYLRGLNQLCASFEYHVCCEVQKNSLPKKLNFPKRTQEPPKRLLDPSEGCGYTNPTLYKAISGNADKVGDWPWVALIGYDDGLSSSPFRCDGTIITARHVITAAQCVNVNLSFIRVGEHDLSREDESEYMDIKIIKIAVHPDYNRQNGRGDIAILYLERNIDFSEKISPICLPQSQTLLTKSYVNYNPFVVGWEKTRKGEKSLLVLQLHQIMIYDNRHCKDVYLQGNRSITDNQFDNATICAGFFIHNREGCHGDAGGPLMMPEIFEDRYHFYLIGVAAYSVKCVKPEFLVTYTDPRFFIDWIREKVSDI